MTPALRAALAACLDDLSRSLLRRAPERTTGVGLADGAAGLALAHLALDEALPGRGHRARAGVYLQGAVAGLSRGALPPSLLEGYVGVAWAAHRLAPDDAGPVTDAVDRALVRAPGGLHDLFHGAAGAIVYASARPAERRARRVITRALDHLTRTAARRDGGLAWRSPPVRGRGASPCQTGLAHGGAGVVAALSACAEAGVEVDRATSLAEGAVTWILARGDEPPDAVFDDGGERAARNAYCLGAPGVALALVRAGDAFGRPAWRAAGRAIGRVAAARSFAESQVDDGGVCHGAAGVALCFHRLAWGCGDPALTAARDRWLERLLEMRRAGRGVAGFRARRHPPSRERFVSDPGLLGGAAGIARVVAAVLGHDGDWDAFLGTALPRRA